MSEALSSSEIEDVLSSIRRLVSEDLRPVSRPSAPAEGDKLMLTPALRVVHSAAEPQRAAPVAAPAVDAVLASVSAGVSLQADQWESETGDTAPDSAGVSQPEDWTLAEGVMVIADYAEAPAAVPIPVVPRQDDQGAPFAEDIAEDPVDEAAPPAVSFLSRRAADRGDLSVSEEHAAGPAPEDRSVDDAAGATLPGWAQADGAEAEEEQAPEAWTAETIEPDRAWADEAEAQIVQELAGSAIPQPEADSFVMNDADSEVPINEDVLREIVRDVLREELQGHLGERITRNIRKLVRAEIARALAAGELL